MVELYSTRARALCWQEVSDALALAIEQRFADARSGVDSSGVSAEIPIDGVMYRTRAQQEPLGHIGVQLPATDGFELALRWTDRDVGSLAGAFDDSCLVETNDVSLASTWLDRESQVALLASRYTSGVPDAKRTTLPMLRDGTWRHSLRDGHVIAERSEAETSVERMTDLIAATLSIASRPVRWARWFIPLGKALGGETASRVELGGKPVLRVRRNGADVTVRLLRRLGPEDPGRLRTVISAHRIASSGETLTLIADDLPRSAWPPPNDLANSSLRIDERARALLDRARPSTTIVRRHDVEITFDGAFADTDRLGAAVHLAAYWATDHSPEGPYR
jgi:hypothetical protein